VQRCTATRAPEGFKVQQLRFTGVLCGLAELSVGENLRSHEVHLEGWSIIFILLWTPTITEYEYTKYNSPQNTRNDEQKATLFLLDVCLEDPQLLLSEFSPHKQCTFSHKLKVMFVILADFSNSCTNEQKLFKNKFWVQFKYFELF
jgi:hypothetical protein